MNGFIKSWKTYAAGLIIAATFAGLSIAADNRWLTRVSFEEWAQAQEDTRVLERIMDLEIEINRLQAEIKWTTNERKAAALEERIRFLISQINDLERRIQ